MSDHKECHFDKDELFFSKTDKLGLIQYGNSVFSRLSGHAHAYLNKKPHNIIRHQDMPRAVFRLFWQAIKNDLPIAAYVKNRSKNGDYYWVVALAFPTSDGYVSIRLKPITDLRSVVGEIYARMIEIETETDDMDQSHAFLMTELEKLGLHSYEQFMSLMLSRELIERNSGKEKKKTDGGLKEKSQLGLQQKRKVIYDEQVPFRVIPKLREILQDLVNIDESLARVFNQVGFVSKNMLICTIHLGKAGRTIAAVSENLQSLSLRLSQDSLIFSQSFEAFSKKVDQLLEYICYIYFQNGMMMCPMDGQETAGVYASDEKDCREDVRQILIKNIDIAQKLADDMTDIHRELSSVLDSFKRISLGVNVICITGKIEITNHLANNTEVPTEIIDVQEYVEDMKSQNDILKENMAFMSRHLLNVEIIIDELHNYLWALFSLNRL